MSVAKSAVAGVSAQRSKPESEQPRFGAFKCASSLEREISISGCGSGADNMEGKLFTSSSNYHVVKPRSGVHNASGR
jgi:hypothetical protein